jgi:hypothetical protein
MKNVLQTGRAGIVFGDYEQKSTPNTAIKTSHATSRRRFYENLASGLIF